MVLGLREQPMGQRGASASHTMALLCRAGPWPLGLLGEAFCVHVGGGNYFLPSAGGLLFLKL